MLGAIFPLIFTDITVGSLSKSPVILALIVTEWAALRLTKLLIAGEVTPRLSWRLLCAPSFARSAGLIAGDVVGVAELVFDRAEHPER